MDLIEIASCRVRFEIWGWDWLSVRQAVTKYNVSVPIWFPESLTILSISLKRVLSAHLVRGRNPIYVTSSLSLMKCPMTLSLMLIEIHVVSYGGDDMKLNKARNMYLNPLRSLHFLAPQPQPKMQSPNVTGLTRFLCNWTDNSVDIHLGLHCFELMRWHDEIICITTIVHTEETARIWIIYL